MSKKIIVVCKELINFRGDSDVDSRFYDENMNPIISRGGVNMDMDEYHLGQISSSFNWAVSDMSYERYKDHFDKLFSDANGDFEFDYQFIKL